MLKRIATGVWRRNRWLLSRRASQLGLLLLFMAGPLWGVWIVKGNLASSTVLGVVSLTDPYIYLQSLVAGHRVGITATVGAVTVAVFYLLVGGRVYCSWVCPVNLVTDFACWLRGKLGLSASLPLKKSARYWIFAMTLPVSFATATIAWEAINPITMLQRGLVFGMGLAWLVVLAVFLLDLLISRRAWCGHLCPVGVFYGFLGKAARLRVNAVGRTDCVDCGDCFRVCPEPQVIMPALKPKDERATSLILSGDCTNCGRCVDVCGERVFKFAVKRWDVNIPPRRKPSPARRRCGQ